MNKKVIYIGLGAVVAYLLYKKFMVKPADVRSAEAGVAEMGEEPIAEEAPSGGGGGGGGGSAPLPPSPIESVITPVGETPVGVVPIIPIGRETTQSISQITNVNTKPEAITSSVSDVPKLSSFPTTQFQQAPTLTTSRPPTMTSPTSTRPVATTTRPVATATRPVATATRPVTNVSRPAVRINPKLSGRLAAPRPVAATARFADFMDFDGNDDVQGSIM
jgi:hypothetical protein